MLDEYFSFHTVEVFLEQLNHNPRYYSKTVHKDSNYGVYIKKYLGIYIFYEALFKYKLLIDDIILFDDYLEQLDKLFRKMNDFDDISIGINKLLCNSVASLLEIEDLQAEEHKKEIVSYLYQKYIVDGYYFHGFPTVYEKSFQEKGLDFDQYHHFYSEMENVASIFEKHGLSNIFQKNFRDRRIYFTDDFVMGCYYSSVAPYYFSQFLTQSEFCKKGKLDDYMMSHFDNFADDLKHYFMINYSLSEAKTIVTAIKKQWSFLNQVPKKISLLLVPRKMISSSCPQLSDYYQKEKSLFEMVDQILSSKSRNLSFLGKIDSSAIKILSFPFPDTGLVKADIVKELDKDLEKVGGKSILQRFQSLNSYGVISIFIVLGSCFITLGIIISILMILGGM